MYTVDDAVQMLCVRTMLIGAGVTLQVKILHRCDIFYANLYIQNIYVPPNILEQKGRTCDYTSGGIQFSKSLRYPIFADVAVFDKSISNFAVFNANMIGQIFNYQFDTVCV